MNNNKIFIMGLPNAGKTTFLAALWYVVSNEENEVKLTLSKIDGNANYLARLSQQWLECEKVERTKRSDEVKEISIYLSDKIYDFVIDFPDLSGETFQTWYKERKVEESIAEQIKSSDSIMFFVNVDDVKNPFLINEANKIIGNENEQEENSSSELGRNKIEDDPTCVQIIELLQFIMYIRQGTRTKLGIVFSAWDLVDEEELHPEGYAKRQLSFLWQFLEANNKSFDVSYWGVSALGGTMNNKDELLAIENPFERLLVVDSKNERSHDITSIIYKMIGEIHE